MHINGSEGPMGPVVAVSDSETASDYSTATSAITTTSEWLSATGVSAHPMPRTHSSAINCVHTLSPNTLAALPDTPVIDETSIFKWLSGVHSGRSDINTHIIAARHYTPALVCSRHPKRHRVPRNVTDGCEDWNSLTVNIGSKRSLVSDEPERFDINQLISALKAFNQNEGRVVAADPNASAVAPLTDNKVSLCIECRQPTDAQQKYELYCQRLADTERVCGVKDSELSLKDSELSSLRVLLEEERKVQQKYANNYDQCRRQLAEQQALTKQSQTEAELLRKHVDVMTKAYKKLTTDYESLLKSYQHISSKLDANNDRYDSAIGDVQTHETKLTSVCKELEELKLKSEDFFNENQTLSEDLKTANEEVLVLDESHECADTYGQFTVDGLGAKQ